MINGSLRIALLTGHLSRRGYGVKNAVELLSEFLVGEGHQVVVFGLADKEWVTSDGERWRGGEVRAYPTIGPPKFGFAPSLMGDVGRFRPHVVHVHGLWMYTSIVGREIARRYDAKLAFSPHGMLSEVALRYSPLQKRLAWTMFQYGCLRSASAIHATARAEESDIRRVLPNSRVAVVANGLRLKSVASDAGGRRQRRVLAIGRLHAKKGFDRLISAWATIEGKFPDWRLEIYGPGDVYRAELVALAKRLGAARASVGSDVTEQERDQLLLSSSLFVLSSLNENFGLTVVEALSCGLPVVATRGTPWGALEDQCCGWWVDGDVPSLAAALEKALTLESRVLTGMGQRGRDWVRREFSSDTIAPAMTRFYKELVSSEISPQ